MENCTIKKLTQFPFFRGRVALHAILKSMGINRGDEVAIQAFTCLAVPEGVMATGAVPRYIDIDPERLTMDASDLEIKISTRTKAVVVQHTFGIPADMDRIVQVARKFNIPVIEDCAHTLLSLYKGRVVGSIGDAAFYSFEWGKPVIAGIGGCATVNNPDLLKKMAASYESFNPPSHFRVQRIKLQYIVHHFLYRPSLYWPLRSAFRFLSSFGLAEGNYNPIQIGNAINDNFHLRMSDYHKALLVKKCGRYDSAKSRGIVSRYRSRITSSAAVKQLTLPDDCDIVFARFPLVTDNKTALLLQAKAANVELADWYFTPVHPLKETEWSKVYYRAGLCPNAEVVSGKLVTLPVHGKVSDHDIDRICSFLNMFVF